MADWRILLRDPVNVHVRGIPIQVTHITHILTCFPIIRYIPYSASGQVNTIVIYIYLCSVTRHD